MKNEEFQTIKRKDFSVTIENEKVLTPEFTKIATSRYRLTSEFALQKQCAKCNKWYNVAKYENGKWIETWKEEEYKQSKTGGFPTYCTYCTRKIINYNSKTRECDRNTVVCQNKTVDVKKDTVLWDINIYKYVMIRAVLDNKSKNQFLNDIFKKVMDEDKKIKLPEE